MTTTKRLEELKLSDTTYHEHHDLHFYGIHAQLNGLAEYLTSSSIPLSIH